MNFYVTFVLGVILDGSWGCFTIIYLSENSCSHIQVIIANNRDENVFRPTNDADYWPQDLSYIYGGRDLVRDYSTWLSMNTVTGRIANLLFLAGQDADGPPKPAGPLVAFYIHSNYSTVTTQNYLNNFYTDGNKYDGIHLLLLDYLENGYWKLYYANNNETDRQNTILQTLVSGTFVISNNLFARPFQKVVVGSRIFNNILERYKGVFNDYAEATIGLDQIKNLIDDMMYEILQNRTFLYKNGRDQNLQERFESKDEVALNEVSAINANYTNLWTEAKTRTNTVIIVFHNGSVMHVERTLKFDLNNNSYWSFKNHTFTINSIKGNSMCRAPMSNSFHILPNISLFVIYALFHFFPFYLIVDASNSKYTF